MKAKVKNDFYDTTAKTARKRGDIIDVSADRFNEIRAKGPYIEAYDTTEEENADVQ